MSSLLRRAFAALALSFCTGAFAATYPTVEEMRTAIAAAAEITRAEGMSLHMEDARLAGVKLPLMAAGLNLHNGVCQVYYNPVPEETLARFFAAVSQSDMPIWLTAIAVHEATHCIEQREVYIRGRFDKVLPPNVEREGMTLKGYLGVVRSGAVETWGEALADIASILYVKRAAPERWRVFAQGIMVMRRDLAAKWPSHDTSPWLARLLADSSEAAPDPSCFEAAFHLRRTLRPQ